MREGAIGEQVHMPGISPTGMSASNRNPRKNRQSISEAISISLGLHKSESPQDGDGLLSSENEQSNWATPQGNNYLGRSYVSGFLSASSFPNGFDSDALPLSRLRTKSIHASQNLHKETAKLSNDFNGDEAEDDRYDELGAHDNAEDYGDYKDNYLENNNDERSFSDFYDRNERGDAISDEYESLVHGPGQTYQAVTSSTEGSSSGLRRSASNSAVVNHISNFCYKFIHYLPAAILGLLLNILDALSYGMIMFPITDPVFSSLGPSGLSIFYISTVISQVTYSSGFSSFVSGIGSEMIEVTPFFHNMALAIKESLPGKDDEIITTTIFCYAFSSIITGATFYLLGKLKLGKIVGFFPRHILIGCIGGVGYFLIATGIEVTTRVPSVEYTWHFLANLFSNVDILLKWGLPALLTAILIVTQRCFQNALVLPSFYIVTLFAFHFIVAITPSLSLSKLREIGWIFPVAASSDKWYDHYKLFDFTKVHWNLVLKQFPTMLALTFFGILHVPINIPALAISLKQDKIDVDKELIAHGYSNFFSGLLGSIQNYLVYTNSVLFIRAGADSAFAGYLLAALTFAVMIIGPVLISFIPICIVGSLIFLLGYELLYESLFETLGKVTTFEYITIVIIVLTMGIFDFVLGVIVGVLIACFSFLFDSAKLKTINGEFDGQVAKSTVYRDYLQTHFLDGVGEQIYVLKLQNVLFFGTIISIEEKINKLLEDTDAKDSKKRRIKYLILDFKNINSDNIDYSAAEGFNRIKRFTQSERIQLIVSSIQERDHIYSAFSKVGLLDDVELFSDLNSALEWCENEFLTKYQRLRSIAKKKQQKKMDVNLAIRKATDRKISLDGLLKKNDGVISQSRNSISFPDNTPRNHQMLSVAQNLFKSEQQTRNSLRAPGQETPLVLPLLLFALKLYIPSLVSEDPSVRGKEVQLWSQLCPYFIKRRLASQSILLHNDNIFFVIESGLIKITFDLPSGTLYETMSNRTCYGKASSKDFSSGKDQKATIITETDAVVWIIDSSALNKLRDNNLPLYTDLILLILSIRDKRFKELLGYTLVCS